MSQPLSAEQPIGEYRMSRVFDRGSEDVLRTVLVVEDDAIVREVTVEILRAAGYRVRVANSSATAVRVFEECDSTLPLPPVHLLRRLPRDNQ